MNQDQKNAINELKRVKDDLQKLMSEARKQKQEMTLKVRERQSQFMQRMGELSFAFGAAIAPIIILGNSKQQIDHINYVTVGLLLYLALGFVLLWKSKSQIEQDSTDVNDIGLSAQIETYPVIYALHKFINYPDNVTYMDEYLEASSKINKPYIPTKVHASFWLDSVGIFMVATFLVVRSIWPFEDFTYWACFIVLIIILLAIILISYINNRESAIKSSYKIDELAKIRTNFQKWQLGQRDKK